MSQKFLSSVALTGISSGSILKVNSSGVIVAAVDGTDYNTGSSQWTTSGNNIYYTTGKVGIGTTSPSNKLHIADSGEIIRVESTSTSGYIAFRESTTARGYLGLGDNAAIFTGATTDSISLRSNSDLHLGGGGNNLQMTLDGTSVGIGETSPDGLLHIKGSAQATEFYIESSTGTASTSGAIKIAQNNRSAEDFAGEMVFYVQDTNVGGLFWREAMAIINNGNVGIGNSSPGNNRLKVTGATEITGNLTLSGLSAGFLKTDANGAVSVDTSTFLTNETDTLDSVTGRGATTTNAIGTGNLTINSSGSAASYIYLLSSTTGESELRMGDTDTDAGSIAYNNNLDRMAFRTNAAERVYIDSSGNVGIGTSSPSYKLTVAGRVSVENDILHVTAASPTLLFSVPGGGIDSKIYNDGSGNFIIGHGSNSDNPPEKFRIDSSGNVGIGITSPTAKLDVYNAATDSGIIANFQRRIDGLNEYTYIKIGNSAPAYFGNLLLSDDVAYVSRAANPTGGNGLFVQASGNVGIGTTSPAYRLDINAGSANVGAIIRSSDSIAQIAFRDSTTGGDTNVRLGATGTDMTFFTGGAEKMRIDSTGNVGIGTTSPSAKLHIDGGTTGDTVKFLIGGNDSIIKLGDNGAGGPHGIQFDYETTNGDGMSMYYRTSPQHIVFENSTGTSGTGIMVIQRAGNVGIGTTTPGSKLHVVGETFIDGTAYFDTDTGAQPFYITRSGASNQALKIYVDDATAVFESIQDENGGESGYGSMKFILDAGDSGTLFQIFHGATERFTLDALGDLSIDGSLYVGGNVDGVDIAAFKTAYDSHTHSDATTSASGFMSSADKAKLDNIASGADDYSGWNITDGTSSTKIEANDTVTLSAGTGMSISNEGGVVTFDVTSHTHDAGDITSGTLSTARLDTDVVTTNTTQTISGNKYFTSDKFLKTNRRVASNQYYPLGHYTPGETVFEIDPTWTQNELREFFNSNSVSWNADSTAPGGYCIYIDGAVNVGGAYNSGFPYIPVDTDDIFYMECWIKNEGTAQGHYMGSIDYNESFGAPSSGSGNPGSYGYWVMSNYTSASSWSKVSGYISGFSNTETGKFETGTKYWTPQALFNYSAGSGTRACRISGWKVIKVNHVGNRTFAGNVGIGTSNPLEKLHVEGAIKLGQHSAVVGNGIAHHTNGYLYVTGGASGAAIGNDSYSSAVYAVDNGSLELYAGSSNRLHITAAGNVGIGTTSPEAGLHVASSSSGGIGGQIVIDNSAGSTLGNTAEISFLTDAGASGTGTRNARILAVNENAGNGAANMQFHTWNGASSAERMRITSGGNVGIGTTSPNVKLQVGSSGALGSWMSAHFQDGIGISPSGSQASVYLYSDGSSIFGINAYDYGTNSYNPLTVGWGGANVYIATEGGNVGIGTTSPSYKLDVNGSFNCTSMNVTNDITTSTGNVVLANDAGIYSFFDTVNANADEAIFRISNEHGAQAFRVSFVCSTSGYSVAKIYEVVHAYSGTPVAFKVVDTGPFGSEDFDVTFADAATYTGIECSIANNSSLNANIVTTIFLAGSPTAITITEL